MGGRDQRLESFVPTLLRYCETGVRCWGQVWNTPLWNRVCVSHFLGKYPPLELYVLSIIFSLNTKYIHMFIHTYTHTRIFKNLQYIRTVSFVAHPEKSKSCRLYFQSKCHPLEHSKNTIRLFKKASKLKCYFVQNSWLLFLITFSTTLLLPFKAISWNTFLPLHNSPMP